jgi:hypothetical protein
MYFAEQFARIRMSGGSDHLQIWMAGKQPE